MYFPKYYNSEQFAADKMHTRAAVVMTNKDYQPPPDIQLFYLLEIINDFAALGFCEFRFINKNTPIDEKVISKLHELGYRVTEDNYSYITTIRWDN